MHPDDQQRLVNWHTKYEDDTKKFSLMVQQWIKENQTEAVKNVQNDGAFVNSENNCSIDSGASYGSLKETLAEQRAQIILKTSIPTVLQYLKSKQKQC